MYILVLHFGDLHQQSCCIGHCPQTPASPPAAGLTERFDSRTDLRFCSALFAAKLLLERNYFGHVKNYEL